MDKSTLESILSYLAESGAGVEAGFETSIPLLTRLLAGLDPSETAEERYSRKKQVMEKNPISSAVGSMVSLPAKYSNPVTIGLSTGANLIDKGLLEGQSDKEAIASGGAGATTSAVTEALGKKFPILNALILGNSLLNSEDPTSNLAAMGIVGGGKKLGKAINLAAPSSKSPEQTKLLLKRFGKVKTRKDADVYKELSKGKDSPFYNVALVDEPDKRLEALQSVIDTVEKDRLSMLDLAEEKGRKFTPAAAADFGTPVFPHKMSNKDLDKMFSEAGKALINPDAFRKQAGNERIRLSNKNTGDLPEQLKRLDSNKDSLITKLRLLKVGQPKADQNKISVKELDEVTRGFNNYNETDNLVRQLGNKKVLDMLSKTLTAPEVEAYNATKGLMNVGLELKPKLGKEAEISGGELLKNTLAGGNLNTGNYLTHLVSEMARRGSEAVMGNPLIGQAGMIPALSAMDNIPLTRKRLEWGEAMTPITNVMSKADNLPTNMTQDLIERNFRSEAEAGGGAGDMGGMSMGASGGMPSEDEWNKMS